MPNRIPQSIPPELIALARANEVASRSESTARQRLNAARRKHGAALRAARAAHDAYRRHPGSTRLTATTLNVISKAFDHV